VSEASPATEARSTTTRGLDQLDTRSLVEVLARENRIAVEAVLARSVEIAAAVDAVVSRLAAGGTLHYVGAGTSGRLGFLDAAECPPTFGTPSGAVRAHIAGKAEALLRAVEGAEDDAEAGAREMRESVTTRDAVVGISASGTAAYVVSALSAARALGALAIAVTNSPSSPLERAAELSIVLETGAEPIAGSTRMKAATAQKLVLNAISTAAMVRLGKVYDNLMVDLVATNEKLRRRALLLVALLAPADEGSARTLLDAAGGSVKTAVVMGRHGVSADAARDAIARTGGSLRAALDP
jgi:N-acetylmuramic acid 6-phosphate etherase